MISHAHRVLHADERQILLPFRPAGQSEPRDDELPLRACYEKFLLPEHQRRAKATRTNFYTALKHWETILGSGDPYSGPSVGSVNDDLAMQFQNQLFDREMAPATINKNCANLQRIFRRCGPRGYGNPQGRGIISEVPFVTRIPEGFTEPRVASQDELSAIYKACSVATWPETPQFPAPLWWRVFHVLCYTFGPRTGDLVPIDSDSPGMLWDAFRADPECPHRTITESNPWGWLTYTPKKTSRIKPHPLYLPLTEVSRKHLDCLPRTALHILHCPGSPMLFRKNRQAIHAAAGIEESYTPQDLRKTCETAWDRISLGLGEIVVGHAPRNVTQRFYRQPAGLLVDAVHKLPQPRAFVEGLRELV